MYTQRNPAWSGKRLGASKWTMGDSGCYVTSVALILADAGWSATPGDVCDALNANGGFTKDGMAIHDKITAAYPQFRYDGSGTYRIVQLRLLSEYHYEAQIPEGMRLDPWTGAVNGQPYGFKLTGSYSAIACDKAPEKHDNEIPVTPAIPAQTSSVTVTVDFVVQAGTGVNWRIAPSLSAPVAVTYPVGTRVLCSETVDGDPVNGTTKWYRSKAHGYFSTAAYNQKL